MARTVYCDDHPDQAGVMLVTNLNTGEVATLCGGCIGPWCLALAQAMMPDAFQDIAVTATTDAPGPEEEGAAPTPPKPKRGRRGRENGPGEERESAQSLGGGDVEFSEEVERALTAPSSPFRDTAPDDS